jgi:hypothetical protein
MVKRCRLLVLASMLLLCLILRVSILAEPSEDRKSKEREAKEVCRSLLNARKERLGGLLIGSCCRVVATNASAPILFSVKIAIRVTRRASLFMGSSARLGPAIFLVMVMVLDVLQSIV